MTSERQFQFDLALALHQVNPDTMLANLPARIYNEWKEYASLNPFGERHADLRHASLMALLANLWARRKNQPAYKVEQFMLTPARGSTVYTEPVPQSARRITSSTPARRAKSDDELHEKMLSMFPGAVMIDNREESMPDGN